MSFHRFDRFSRSTPAFPTRLRLEQIEHQDMLRSSNRCCARTTDIDAPCLERWTTMNRPGAPRYDGARGSDVLTEGGQFDGRVVYLQASGRAVERVDRGRPQRAKRGRWQKTLGTKSDADSAAGGLERYRSGLGRSRSARPRRGRTALANQVVRALEAHVERSRRSLPPPSSAPKSKRRNLPRARRVMPRISPLNGFGRPDVGQGRSDDR